MYELFVFKIGEKALGLEPRTLRTYAKRLNT